MEVSRTNEVVEPTPEKRKEARLLERARRGEAAAVSRPQADASLERS
jgi:hypothetical protein